MSLCDEKQEVMTSPVLQVSEELEKVKQEMEEKGSSMSDGGEAQLSLYIHVVLFLLVAKQPEPLPSPQHRW